MFVCRRRENDDDADGSEMRTPQFPAGQVFHSSLHVALEAEIRAGEKKILQMCVKRYQDSSPLFPLLLCDPRRLSITLLQRISGAFSLPIR